MKTIITGLLIIIVVMLPGCTKATMTFQDGRKFEYQSSLFDKKFGEMILYPDGSLAITAYQSDLQSMITLVEKLTVRIPATKIP